MLSDSTPISIANSETPQSHLKPPYAHEERPYVVELEPVSGGRKRRHLGAGGRRSVHWDVYEDPEHYPICACCGGPTPCRWQEAKKAGEQAVRTMTRFELAGVCPACGEVVTKRQRSFTWPDNVEVIGGPPVTFHTRSHCWSSAREYERKWVADAPEQRRAKLSCVGRVITHGDGTYECSELADCPGPQASHNGYTTCRAYGSSGCVDDAGRAAGRFGCNVSPGFGLRLPDGSVRSPDGSLL